MTYWWQTLEPAASTQLLLDRCADPDLLTPSGTTALRLVIQADCTLEMRLEAVKMLVRHHASLTAQSPGDRSPLYLAACTSKDRAKHPQPRALRELDSTAMNWMLEQEYSLELEGDNGGTILAELCSAEVADRHALITALISRGAGVQGKNREGHMPLQASIRVSDQDAITLLMNADPGKLPFDSAGGIEAVFPTAL
jgi:hypothetical protein